MRAIMKRQLLHTPEGVRDIYNDECEKKMLLQDQLYHILRLHGYHPIQTPTFEFFDIFGILARKNFRSGCATWGILSSITAAIRDD